jgi:hypothetical protein
MNTTSIAGFPFGVMNTAVFATAEANTLGMTTETASMKYM